MLVDLTLEITPEMAAQHGMHAGKLPGHLGTHFDVMNKTFPLDYTTREAIVFDVSAIKDREIEPEDIDLCRPVRICLSAFTPGLSMNMNTERIPTGMSIRSCPCGWWMNF